MYSFLNFLCYNIILFTVVYVCLIVQFKSLAPLYYRDAAAAILVYDITSDVSMNICWSECA